MTTNASSKSARQALSGIVDLACRLANRYPKDFSIKIGGDQKGGRAEIDWYVTVVNSTARRNTARAKEEGLIRRAFGIYQKHVKDEIILKILEWTAEADWEQPHRLIWSGSYSDLKARNAMAQLMAESIGNMPG
jgi:hypothetical protein